MTLNPSFRRRSGVGPNLLRLGLLAAGALSLILPLPRILSAQRPVAGNSVRSGASPLRASMPSDHAQPHSSASVPTPQPHLRSHIGLNLGLGGRWWDESSTIKQLNLTPEQQRRMDSIFEANKPALMSLYLNMQREQTHLSTLPPAELQDQSKVFAAIDRVSQARCDLEKENAHILIQIRQQLDAHQLQTLDHEIAALQ